MRKQAFMQTSLLARVSRMYYELNLTQDEIASRIGVSRPTVSRLLHEARRTGIVRITISTPFDTENRLAARIVDEYQIADAIVAPDELAGDGDGKQSIGAAAATLLERMVKEKDVVVVSGGTTVLTAVDNLMPLRPRRISVVPIVGGMGRQGARWHSNDIARRVAGAFEGEYYLINAPAVVQSLQVQQAFLSQAVIQENLKLAETARIALVGVGALSPMSTMIQPEFFSSDELMSLADLGVVGNIGVDFFNSEGSIVQTPLNDRLVGLSLKRLAPQALIFGVAEGPDKISAIKGALAGRLITTLVTTATTARALCSDVKSR